MKADKYDARFHRTAVKAEPRLMIQSICAKCGESKLVSHYDSSLEVWEDQHECKSKAKSMQSRAS